MSTNDFFLFFTVKLLEGNLITQDLKFDERVLLEHHP